jgi:hypothetical protein
MMAPFLPLLNRPGSEQVPKYFLPFFFMAASMLCAAWRVKSSSTLVLTSETGAASEPAALKSRMVVSENFIVSVIVGWKGGKSDLIVDTLQQLRLETLLYW